MIPIALAAAGVGALVKGITGIFQNKKANKIKPVDTTYNISPYAKDSYALARQYLNSRMAGATNAERNILGAQANTMDSVSRNASDSSQALMMAAASEGQANQSFVDLANTEAQNKQAMLGNFNQATGVMINEGDKVYQDQVRKYNNQVQEKNALRQAAWQNIGSAINSATNAVVSAFPGASIFGGKTGIKQDSNVTFDRSAAGVAQHVGSVPGINTGRIGGPPRFPNVAGFNTTPPWRPPMAMGPQQIEENRPRVWPG